MLVIFSFIFSDESGKNFYVSMIFLLDTVILFVLNALMSDASDLQLFTGRPIIVDFSPVTDFREATCRQYDENTCSRGGYCNFMHLKKIGE